MKKTIAALVVILAVFACPAISDGPAIQDPEFTFARARFTMNPTWRSHYREEPWHHDYPFAEDLFLTMVTEATGIHSSREAFQIVDLDSPDLFKYPFLYISEPGYMELNEREITNFRAYLNRGGFVVCDDFRGLDLDNLRFEMKKVFPDREMSPLTIQHEVFHTFYDIDNLVMDPPYRNYNSGDPAFWGLSDEHGRLLMVANHNNDLGEFWQWVDEGESDFQPAAKSVRLGINYLIYALTH